MREIIRRAKRIVAEPEATDLKDDDVARMRETLQSAEEEITAGHYAAAWYRLTHHRLWTLLREVD
jgi:hypothetical protein